MDITRNDTQTFPGPNDWFTGSVFIDPISPMDGTSRLSVSLVHFTPGARTAWHTHPKGQTLWVTQGVGLVQRRGGPVEVIRPGDRVFIGPDEDHWHGATPDRIMSHVALAEADEDGKVVTWGEHVTDDEYNPTPNQP